MKSKHKRRKYQAAEEGARAVHGSAGKRTPRFRIAAVVTSGACLMLAAIWFGIHMRGTSDSPGTRHGEQYADRGGSGAASASVRAKAREGGNQDAVVSKVNRANQLLSQGSPAEAVQVLKEALTLNPDDEDIHYNLGLAYTRLGQLDEAVHHYHEALRIFPNYVEAHNNLGNVLMRAGKAEEAIDQFELAVKIKPDYASAHNNLGTALQRAGRRDEALVQFQEAAKLMPDYWEAHFNLGTCLLEAADLKEARAQFETVLRLKPDFEPAKAALAGLEKHRASRGP